MGSGSGRDQDSLGPALQQTLQGVGKELDRLGQVLSCPLVSSRFGVRGGHELDSRAQVDQYVGTDGTESTETKEGDFEFGGGFRGHCEAAEWF